LGFYPGTLKKNMKAQSIQLVFGWSFETCTYRTKVYSVTAVSASSIFIRHYQWQNIVEDELDRKAIDAEFCDERSGKSPLRTPYMKDKGNTEVDVVVTWQRLVALAQDYIKEWVSYNPK
jgi:hypothetical protein